MNCVFWNVNRADRTEMICQLAKESEAGIVVIAEPQAVKDKLARALKETVASDFTQLESSISRLTIVVRRRLFQLREIYSDIAKRVSISRLQIGADKLLFVALHGVDKGHYDENDQTMECRGIADEIRRFEQKEAHCRTIAVGDFNVNPFEPGMISAAGFHAMSTLDSIGDGQRKVQRKSYPFFYNPMWSFLGDRSSGPPGTYFYRRKGHHLSYDWNVLDQVLFRPDALPWFSGDVEIVTRIGGVDLRGSRGRPNASIGSDHFPIRFGISRPRRK